MTLSSRIEAASGPDRELDAEIARLLGMCLHPNKIKTGAQSDTGFDCIDCGADSWGNRSKDGHNRRLHDPVPPYTASIDAALTLVPEGMRDEIEITTLYQVARVGINLNHGPDDGPYYGENACNSIPLALAAAAIRAKGTDNVR